MIEDGDPLYADALLEKGIINDEYYEVSREQAKLDEATRCYSAAMAARPGFDELLYKNGLLFYKYGRTEDAVESFNGAIKLRPIFPDAINAMGRALNDLGRHEDAIQYLEAAIRLKPGFAEAVYNKADIMRSIGMVEESAGFLDEAVRLDPSLRNHEGIRRMLDERPGFKRRTRGKK